MARHKLFCVPGTWEAVAAANGDPGGITPGAEIGMLKGITDFLNRNVFDIVYVNYPASFGPIPGGGEDLLEALGNPSYLKSRDMGVAEVKRLIGLHQGSFGLLGYSQGGAVVAYEGISGDNIVNTGTIDWFDYCLPGDIYGNADIRGTYLKQGYDLVTPLSLVDPFTMIAQIAANLARWLQTGELAPLNIFRAVKTAFDLMGTDQRVLAGVLGS